MVGMGGAHRDLDGVCCRNGLLFGRVGLGVGCGRDTLCPARARGRPNSPNNGVLSSIDGMYSGHGLGVGRSGLGRHEVLQAC